MSSLSRSALRRRAATVAFIAAAAGALAACAPEPFIDMRREAGTLTTIGSSSLHRPAICYNTMNATREEVQALADAVCAETGRVAVYQSTDMLMCTVLQPHRSLFSCVMPEQAVVDAYGVRRLRPGVLGVQVPGVKPTEAEDEEDLPIPEAPPAPPRPPSGAGGGLLGLF